MNRKERRLALRTALMSRAEDLVVVSAFSKQLTQPKTKELVQALARWGVSTDEKVLLIIHEKNDNLYLSSRNLPKLRLMLATQLNVFDLLHADKVVATEAAIAKIQEVYGV
ncbi:MAG: 50S ribosomal protein L4, partial [Spirulinaceae cyanobacterium]